MDFTALDDMWLESKNAAAPITINGGHALFESREVAIDVDQDFTVVSGRDSGEVVILMILQK